MPRKYKIIIFTLMCTFFVACTSKAPVVEPAVKSIPEKQLPQLLQTEIRNHFHHPDLAIGCCKLDREKLGSFYQRRNFTTAWWSYPDNQPKPAMYALLNALQFSSDHGLKPNEYHYEALLTQLPATTPETIAIVDLLLTDAFLKYSQHLYSGRYAPRQLDPKWHIEPERLNTIEFLEQILAHPDFQQQLESLAPPHKGYQQLKKSLAHYRELAKQARWPIIASGPLLEKGDRDLRVHELRERLQLEGYLSNEYEPDEFLFDGQLEEAVKRFQELHGIDADGIIGSKTLASMNISPRHRIVQILLNMERWRWLPRDLGDRYIMVNMAGFNLQAIENDQTIMDMRVIIGKPYRSTPAFIGKMTYLVVNPYWNVPKTILREDIIPSQRQNPDYLQSKSIRVFESWQENAREIDPADIDWQGINPKQFPYRLRQDSGPHNSLGRLKFMLPNEHDVYLHDTPTRHLFEETVRTFSSGCIRIEQPLQLASYLLEDSEKWDETSIQEQIDTGENQTIVLPDSLPVYLLYWTAWVDDKGITHFANDVYGLDERMATWRTGH